jgi:hypothetical protein
MPEFIILRNAAARRTASGFEHFGPSAASAAPPEPRVETHDISTRKAVNASRDPSIAAEGIVSVAAVGQGAGGKFSIASFSNTMTEIAAPGVDIVSAKPGGGLQTMSGTSMACPHVAGVATLWWHSMKKAGAVRPNAGLVVNNLLANARANVFTPDVTPEDRGSGMVAAPQAS